MNIGRIARLSKNERRFIAAAVVLLPIAHVLLRVAGFARCWALSQLVPKAAAARDRRDEDARAAAYAVCVAARRTLFRPTCLPQSLVLWCILRRMGIDSTLRIGFRKSSGHVEGHAWVELDGVALNDDIDVHGRFAAFEHAVADS